MFKLIAFLFLFGCSNYEGCYVNQHAQHRDKEPVLRFLKKEKYMTFHTADKKKIVLRKKFFLDNYVKVNCK